MTVKALLRCLLALMWLGLALPALAMHDWVVKRGVLGDPQGTLRIEDVQTLSFKSVSGPISKGHVKAVTWMRVEVAPSDLPVLVLSVQPAQLDDVQVYTPAKDGGGWQMKQGGDRFAFNSRERSELNFSANITPDPQRTTVHFVRMSTTSVHMLHVKVLSVTDAQRRDGLFNWGLGAYAGLISMLCMGSLLHWWFGRVLLWAIAAVSQGVTVVFVLSIMGILGRYLWPDAPATADITSSLLACTHWASGSLFFCVLFKSLGAPRWVTWVQMTSLALFPVMLVAIVLGYAQEALTMLDSVLLVAVVFGSLAVWFVRPEDAVMGRLVRSSYIVLLLYLVFFLLPLFGLVPMTELNLYPALLSNLFTAVMLHVILLRADHSRLKNHLLVELDLRNSQQKLAWERGMRAETSSFMSMLMHELKNPLAAIRMATLSLKSPRMVDDGARTQRLDNITKSVENMNAVLERCREADRIEQGSLSFRKESHDLAELVAQWLDNVPQAGRIQTVFPRHAVARVDVVLLDMMVKNLLSNALMYSPPESRVDLVLRYETDGPDTLSPQAKTEDPGQPTVVASSDTMLWVKVLNTVGKARFPDATKVFTKYYRAETAHHQTGTGLGLHWVRSVAILMGGGVHYRIEGEQVVFELWLPC